MSDLSLREEIIATANAMNATGLSPGKSGNVSARNAAGNVLITPTGVAYAALKPGDIVTLDGQGNVLAGGLQPSSEWHFHVAVYNARPEIGAIVHAHSLYATALACARREIPAFHYMVRRRAATASAARPTRLSAPGNWPPLRWRRLQDAWPVCSPITD